MREKNLSQRFGKGKTATRCIKYQLNLQFALGEAPKPRFQPVYYV